MRMWLTAPIVLSMCWMSSDTTAAELGGTWKVTVNASRPIGDVSRYFAGANVNTPGTMLIGRDDFDEAVADLGVRMMRFQVPASALDYQQRDSWTDETFAVLDQAVEKARTTWGVQRLMFGISRLSIPFRDGRFVEEDFPAYADACARLVERYSPPGNVRVEFWEPFNERADPNLMKGLVKHGQGYNTLLALYNECASRMKAINPDIKVGGPALCSANLPQIREFLETSADSVEFVSWHDYPTGSAETSDAVLLSSITGKGRFLGATRAIESILASSGRDGVPLFLSEFHINWSAWKPVDVRTANQFTAVFAASVFANLSETSLTSAMIHDVRIAYYGLVGPASRDGLGRKLGIISDSDGSDPIHIRPIGWVYHWFNELVRGQWTTCHIDLPAEDAETDRGRLLDACAWRDSDQWGVMLVNKDTEPHDLTLHARRPVVSAGFGLPMKVYTLAENRAYETQTSGTRSGQWRTTLPPMSVTFVTAPCAD